jgi:maltose alpha-D-glucosyltransferase/alpha-amylase
MQNLSRQELRLLRKNLKNLPEDVQEEAREVLDLEKTITQQLRGVLGGKLEAKKIRIHGDYHLGQVLYTGRDFVIFDFEGEPARALSERRLKRSPVRDVAGMIRSFQYAAYAPLLKDSSFRQEDIPRLMPWGELWYMYVSGIFLRGYLEALSGKGIVPEDPERINEMLVPYLLEKAIYEMGYELNNRPDWLIIPLRGIKYLCGE